MKTSPEFKSTFLLGGDLEINRMGFGELQYLRNTCNIGFNS